MKRILIFYPADFSVGLRSKKPVIVQMPPAVSGTTLATADMESVRYGET